MCICVCVTKMYLDCFVTLLLLAHTSTTHIHGEQSESFPACNKSAACVTTECKTVYSCMSDFGVPKTEKIKLKNVKEKHVSIRFCLNCGKCYMNIQHFASSF
jgi:hypothetical protein